MDVKYGVPSHRFPTIHQPAGLLDRRKTVGDPKVERRDADAKCQNLLPDAVRSLYADTEDQAPRARVNLGQDAHQITQTSDFCRLRKLPKAKTTETATRQLTSTQLQRNADADASASVPYRVTTRQRRSSRTRKQEGMWSQISHPFQIRAPVVQKR